MDDERLSEGGVRKPYFQEWEERIRKIRWEQAQVAKNYLEELELKRLNLSVEQFLSFAESCLI